MDKPRRRAQHLQLVHSQPASTAPPLPPPRSSTQPSRTAMFLGVASLALLVWTRASDMPEPRARAAVATAAVASPVAGPIVASTETAALAPPQGDAVAEVAQSFPAMSPVTRHISAVLAFDAFAVVNNKPPTAPLESGDRVAAGAALIFQLYNRSSRGAHFLLFGVDPHLHFSWLYPPSLASGVNRSLPLAAVPTIELPEPIALPAPSDDWTVVAVFTDAPVTTDEVKQAWTQGGAMAVQSTLHAQVQTLSLNPHRP